MKLTDDWMWWTIICMIVFVFSGSLGMDINKYELRYWRNKYQDDYMQKVKIRTFRPKIEDKELWR